MGESQKNTSELLLPYEPSRPLRSSGRVSFLFAEFGPNMENLLGLGLTLSLTSFELYYVKSQDMQALI